MIFYPRFVPGLAISSYLIGDDQSGAAVVIDPPRDVGEFIEFARQHDLHIQYIIETHVHADFVSGSRELKARLDNQPQIYCSAYGDADWTQAFADQHVSAGDTLSLGQLRFEFRHVPGHTPEHIAILLFDESRSRETPWCMFSGDFLFVGDVGRPDLLGEAAQQKLAHQLYQSVFERLEDLPDFLEIFPAHGAGSLCGKAIGSRRSSTLGFERRFSEILQKTDEESWTQNLLDDMPLAPSYFKRMKQINQQGPPVIGPDLPGQKRWSAEQVAQRQCEDCLILDVRSKEAYAAAHIPDSINIPRGSNLPTWAGWVLPYDCPILLVMDDPAQLNEVVTHLLRVGFDDIQGYLEGGMGAWETAGLPLEMLDTISVQTLHQKLRGQYPLTVLDVRTEREWNAGHIKGALHIHGGILKEHFEDIPQEQPIAVVCGSGYRASIAASFIRQAGFTDVANVLGGMSAWKAADLPLTA